MTDLLDTFAGTVENKICGVGTCTSQPVAERNDRKLCVRHREMFDHTTSGEACERCGSRQWVRTPDAASEAWCVSCEFVTYDEEVFRHSW
jgi:hypothetical protein